MLERYLVDLERELASKLSATETQAILAEARDHLQQSIQARLELGTLPELAEREAIAAFGESPNLVARLSDVRRVRFLSLRLGGFAMAMLACLVGMALFLSSDTGWIGVTPLIVTTLLLVWSLTLGFWTRRAAPVPYFLGGLVASVVFTLFLGTMVLNLKEYGGSSNVVRWNARQNVLQSLARPIPAGRTWSGRDTRGHPVTYAESRMIPAYDGSDLAAIPKAEADPIGNALSQMGSGFSTGMGFASIAGGADLVGAGLGWLWLRLRRPRRPTAVA